MWVGTQEGLYRFDGANSTTFNSDDNNENWIPASDIRGISETANGGLIVATYGGGLIQWDNFSSKFIPLNLSTTEATSHITEVYVSSIGNMWLGTKDSFILYDTNLGSVITWANTEDIRNTIARPFVFKERAPGEIFIGSSNGLIEVSIPDQKAFKYDLSSLGIESKFGVTALEIGKDGNIIVGTDTGHLALLSTENRSVVTQNKLGGDLSILISDFATSEGRLLIATDRGLYSSEADLSNIVDISRNGSGLSNSDIYALYADGKYTYIGTYNGLDVLSFSPFQTINSNNSSIYNDVLAFAEDHLGRFWVGTYDGLYSYESTTIHHRRFIPRMETNNLANQRITAITSSDKHIWVGFYQGGIQSINPSTGDIENPDIVGASEMFVTDLLTEEGSQDLWIATYSHGLIRKTSDETFYFYNSGLLPESRVLKIHELTNGNILFSTTDKIYSYNSDSGKFEHIATDFGLNDRLPTVLSLNEAEDGTIWFGTKDNGLFKSRGLDRTDDILHLQQVNRSSAFRHSTIYGIQIDEFGYLWCSTQNGIVKLDPDGNLIKRFTTADGLQGNDFNFGASYTSRDGLIYFGGVNGYNRFDPKTVEIDRSVSPMRLTNVFFPGSDARSLRDLSSIEDVHLTHKDKSITFQFSVLDFVHPEKNQFRYMLKDFDSDWIENGARNTATYTNLPSGSYVLKVQGANSAGIWNRDGIQLNIHVSPPPWLSWWAICLYVILLLFLWWCSLRIQRSYFLDRYAKAVEMEMIEADNRADDDIQEQVELQDEIVQSAYEHSIATLSLINDSISYQAERHTAKSGLASSSIKHINALTHLEDCIYFEDGVPVANMEKFGDLVLSEQLQKTLIDTETTITINEIGPKLVPAEIASPAAIVLYELMENCFLHAFEAHSLANYIHLKMEGVEDRDGFDFAVRFFVGDNGVGLPQGSDRLIQGSGGIGLAHAIVNHFGGTMEFAQSDGCGITVTFPATEPI